MLRVRAHAQAQDDAEYGVWAHAIPQHVYAWWDVPCPEYGVCTGCSTECVGRYLGTRRSRRIRTVPQYEYMPCPTACMGHYEYACIRCVGHNSLSMSMGVRSIGTLSAPRHPHTEDVGAEYATVRVQDVWVYPPLHTTPTLHPRSTWHPTPHSIYARTLCATRRVRSGVLSLCSTHAHPPSIPIVQEYEYGLQHIHPLHPTLHVYVYA